MTTITPAISINNLRYTWPKTSQPVINIPQWNINVGSRVFLYGRSGSGKSTLLNILAGILQPQQGHIDIYGKTLTELNQRQRDKFRAEYMGVIFQQFNLIPYLSVANNIGLSQYFSGKDYNQDRLSLLMKQLNLHEDILQQQANQLSVGQQQRVAVARALYHQPKLIIADEPTSALDTETRDNFIELLLTQCQLNNSTVLFVSHDKTLATHFDQLIDLQQLNEIESKYAI